MPIKYTHEALSAAAAGATTLDEALASLDRKPDRYNRRYLQRRPAACAVDTSHFTGQARNRGRKFPSKLAPDEILVPRPTDAERLPGARIRRALAELGRPEACEGCGTGP
ncbi:hypothetical protein [Kitasatospora sp. NPDC057223]|uniref:hypothetical protein n=1 Tax=Kitasatospora sp. NPDC057223 TaxID=3346055 RepID=UPI003630F97A